MELRIFLSFIEDDLGPKKDDFKTSRKKTISSVTEKKTIRKTIWKKKPFVVEVADNAKLLLQTMLL